VLPLRRAGPLVRVVTAFTVGHSLTLVASALDRVPDALWFPPLIELLIAASIVGMALENIVRAARGDARAGPPAREWRWIAALLLGLVHGFGFAFALRETLQLAGSHLLSALVAFNAGVELGQLAALAILIPVLHLWVRYAGSARIASALVSALVAHTAWHWLLERGAHLAQFDLAWPLLDATALASVLRSAGVAVILAALIWLLKGDRRDAMRTGRASRVADDRTVEPVAGGVEGAVPTGQRRR